jgi:hypothetical protein
MPEVVSIAQLDALERAQLVACAGRGSDVVFTVEELFSPGFAGPGDRAWIAETAEVPVEWWDVVEDGEPRFRLWLMRADCGFLVRAGTTTIVGDAPQAGSAWEGFDEWAPEQRSSFAASHRRRARELPHSELAHFHPVE